MKKNKTNLAKKLGFSILMLCGTASAAPMVNGAKASAQVESTLTKPVKKKALQNYTKSLYFTDSSADVDESDTYGYKWDKASKTLTLSGLNLVTGMCPALELPTGSTIYLEKNTENNITLEDHAVTQSTTGGYDLGNARATAGIYVGDGTSASTVNILGYGSLKTTVGHMDDEMVGMGTASYKIRYTFGVCGNIVVGNDEGTDSPKVDIIVNDDVLNFTLSGTTYTTGIQVLRRGCGFTLNNGNLHLKAGKANIAAILYLASTMVYNKGKIVLEISKECNTSFICYGSKTEITNSKKLPITVKDENGNDLTFNTTAGVYNSSSGKAYYVIIDISKQIVLESKSGGMQVGKAGEVVLDYSTANLEEGDTIGIEYYNPTLQQYTTTLPDGMSKEIDTTNQKIKLITQGKAPEGTYQFRLVLTASSTYDYQTFYSDDFNFIVGFEPTGNEYDSGGYTLEESDNPEKTNESITIEASDGYSVSKDGENYSDSVTYDEESSKTNPITHATLYIKRDSDDSVSQVEFDYALDTTSPTASLGSKTSYSTPTTVVSTNSTVTVSLSNVTDSLSEEKNIKKEYVILDSALTAEELAAKEKDGTLTWSAATSSKTDEEGNPIYDISVPGNNGDTKVVYVKITDEAGNITYLASDIYSFDTVAPTIEGLDEDTDYYVTTGFTVSEDATVTYTTSESSTPVTLKKNDDGTYSLPGDVSTTYTITVTDAAGNKSTKTVSMNKTESLASSISGITEDTVTTEDKEDVQAILDAIDEIDVSTATEEEKKTISGIAENCNALLAKIEDIEADIATVEKIHNYSSSTVTSDDKTQLETIRDTAKALLDSDNLTEEQNSETQTDYDTAVALLSKIADIESDMKSVTDAIGTLTEDTVTSANEDSLKTALTTVEGLLSDSSKGNLTTTEQETLASQKETIEALLNRIKDVKDAIDALDSAVDGKTTSNVTSADKEAIEAALTDAKAISSGNLTSAEKTALDTQIENAEALLKKIDDVANAISALDSAVDGKTTANITSADKDAIAKALENAKALSEGNLTNDEKTALNAQIANAEELLKQIETVEDDIADIKTAVDGKTKDNVTSADKETLQASLENANALLGGNNLTADEITEVTGYKDTITALLAEIEKDGKVAKIKDDASGYTIDTVTSADKEDIEGIVSDIETTLSDYTDTLTAAEKTELSDLKTALESYLGRIEEVSGYVSALDSSVDGKTTSNVTSADKEAIEAALTDAKALSSGNLTSEEKTALDAQIANAEALLAKIEETEKAIAAIDKVKEYDSTTVKTEDKNDLETIRDNALALSNSDNLTAEEKTNALSDYNAAVTLLDKISDIESKMKSVTDAIGSLTEDTVTSADKSALESALSTVEGLLSDSNKGNLTAEQQKTLASQKETIESLLSKIGEVEDEIAAIKSALDGKTKDNVTSADKTALESAREKAESLLKGTNLTADEVTEVTGYKDTISSLLFTIDKDGEIAKVKADASGYSVDTVTSQDKEDIEGVVSDIEKILTDYADALTDADKNELNNLKSNLETCLGRIETVSDKIASVTDVTGKTTDNVTSADKDALTAVKETVDDLLENYSGNLTAEEKAKLTSSKNVVDPLVEKIEEVAGEIAALEKKDESYDPDTVTSADKEGVESAMASAKALLDSENLTESERTKVQEIYDNLKACDDRIKDVSDAIAALDDAVEGKTTSNVTSQDKDAIKEALDDAKSILSTNLTGEEKTALDAQIANAEALLKKIEDVSNAIDALDKAVDGKTTSNVTSADKEAIEAALTDAKALSSGNLTSEEKTALDAQIENAESLLSKIGEVEDEINAVKTEADKYTTDNAKTSDGPALDELLADINDLLDSGNLTESQTSELNALKGTINSCKDKISDTKDKIDSINDALSGKTTDNVKIGDKTALKEAEEKIDELLAGDNVTSSERADLVGQKSTIGNLLDKIDEVETAISDATKDLDGKTVDNVTKDDKEALKGVESKVDKVLSDYDGNLTAEDKAALNSKKEEAKTLLDKISNTQTEIDSINDKIGTKTEDNVKTTDKEELNDALDIVNELLNGSENLTKEEKASVEEKKTEIENLLNKIDETEKALDSIDEAIDGKTTDNVTSDDKTSLEDAKETIEEILASDNLTSEEKASLTEKENTIDNLLDKIDEVEKAIDEATKNLDGKTTDNIKTSDKTVVEDAKNKIDDLLTDYASNLTEEEKSSIASEKEEAQDLLDKIDEIEKALASIDDAIDGKTTSNVKTGDKESLDTASDKIDSLLASDNLTSEEKASLTEKETTVDALLDKVDEIEKALASIDDVLNGKTTSNVKSSDENAITGASNKIDEVLTKYNDNLTSEQKADLATKKSKTESLLDKIDEVSDTMDEIFDSIGTKTELNVTTEDKASLEATEDKIDTLLASDNLTADERKTLTQEKASVETMLDKIDSVETGIDAVDVVLKDKTISNVTSDDETDLILAKDTIDELLDGNNLTSEQRASLAEKKNSIESMLDKIDEISGVLNEIESSLDDKTASNIKSSDEAALEKTKKEIEDTLTNSSSNLTTEEKAELNKDLETIDTLLKKIDDTKKAVEDIKDSLNGKTTDNVTSSDKAGLEETKNEINSLLDSDNLTEEEKGALTTDKNTADALLNKIDEVANEVKEVKDKIEEIVQSGVTDKNKEDLEDAIEKAESLADSDNLTDEEKTSLKTVITSAKDALKNATSTKQTNIWWVIITLGIVALVEACIIAKKKKGKKKYRTYSVTLLPLVALASLAIPAGQLLLAGIAGVVVLALTIYLIYLFASKKENEDDKSDDNLY